MQVTDATLARTLTADRPTLPPRLSPDRLRRLAAGATLLGGHHETLAVEAPFTGERIGDVLLGKADDVEYAVERARRAQRAWAKTPVSERARVLVRLHDLLLERQAEGLDLIQLESGKARIDAFIEYLDVAAVSRYYAYHGPKHLRTERRRGFIPLLTQTQVHHHPIGVVGVIAPWNYPLTMAITDALPALLAGNAVVVKPAEETPFSALFGAQMLYEAGLPPELFHVVPGRGEEAGAALIDAADFIHFTGSTEVGKIVWRHAGEELKGVSLELGGKNPLIVRADADLDKALEGVRQACFSAAGQLCISAERLYVHESIFDAFAARLVAATEAMALNARYDFSAHMGSLVSQTQLDKVTEHVRDAVAKGAHVLAGGHALPEIGPLFYAPTLLTGVERGMKVYREETFGPVASLYPFSTDDEAVAMANDSAYGLNASVWTRDLASGRRIAAQIACGTVGINDAFVAAWGSVDAPMGGFKQSGTGRRHGREGILKYTESQNVATQLGAPLAPGALGVSQERYAGATELLFRIARRLPGLR